MSDDEFHDMHSRSGLWYSISNLLDEAKVGPVAGTAINLGFVALGVAAVLSFESIVIQLAGGTLAILSALAIIRWVVAEL
jgi:hypothetical protein